MALAARNRNLLNYIEALEGERIKILMFSRELPLCLELISQAIEIRRREMTGDASSGDFPILKEFIPLKPTYSSSGSEETHKESVDSKPDWLRSVQLSSPAAAVEKSPGESSKPRKLFEKEEPCPPPAAVALENIADHRKQRRCWSPELHRKFLDALEQLGGSRSATPKQIRELMNVERLTNDEVKSHLQKYRLHTKRPPSTTIQSSSCCISPRIPPQFVLVGGIWVPPPEYAVVATAAEQSSAAFNGIHSSVPSVVLDSGLPEEKQDKQKQLNDLPSRPSQSYGDDNNLADESTTKSDSCGLSSISQTTTFPPLDEK